MEQRTPTRVPRLEGPPGRALELEILGYQLPARGGSGHTTPGRDYDANWLVVQITAADGRRRWSVADPALLTWEAKRLAQWLRAVASRATEAPTVFAAIEPNLELEARRAGEATHLRVTFDQEFSPWEGDPWIDFAPTDDTLRQFAADLDVALARFPER